MKRIRSSPGASVPPPRPTPPVSAASDDRALPAIPAPSPVLAFPAHAALPLGGALAFPRATESALEIATLVGHLLLQRQLPRPG